MKVEVEEIIGTVTREVSSREHEGKLARVVVATRDYDTHVHDLWEALTSPERIPRWFLPVSGDLRLGRMVSAARERGWHHHPVRAAPRTGPDLGGRWNGELGDRPPA